MPINIIAPLSLIIRELKAIQISAKSRIYNSIFLRGNVTEYKSNGLSLTSVTEAVLENASQKKMYAMSCPS